MTILVAPGGDVKSLAATERSYAVWTIATISLKAFVIMFASWFEHVVGSILKVGIPLHLLTTSRRNMAERNFAV